MPSKKLEIIYYSGQQEKRSNKYICAHMPTVTL